MTVTTHLSAPEGGWTADDLAEFPDDGLRYELVDGVLLTPTLTVLELRGASYVEVAVVTGDTSVELALPFPITLTPSALLR